ncbi:MAG: sigma-70 family RNA polymerase sigma factor [Candidatus Kapabacteria bacterium]|nr:sigma-70 family RNA polymerase sigma factor [Ignavibacteriota bacterium]MCW5884710.1 sigma-70 family RNA polymerase sigma factor [Candidatus Kapabacteria bacterium]
MSEIKSRDNNISQNEDLKVIERILAGDNNAFGILQKKYQNVLSSLIRKMVKDEDDIDDLLQETYIKAYRAMDRYKSDFTFSAWIYRIASNTCIDFLRKKRLNIISLDKPIAGKDDDDDAIYMEIEDNSLQPDTEYINQERVKALQTAIENLPEKYRIIIKLRHDDEMDYNEISNRLDMPLGTVKAHLFRARKMLLDDLKRINYMFTD